MVAFNS